MRRILFTLFAAVLFTFGGALPSHRSSSPSVDVARSPAAAPWTVAASAPSLLGCGETRCTRDADCPATCGGCITWSGTCALFQPR